MSSRKEQVGCSFLPTVRCEHFSHSPVLLPLSLPPFLQVHLISAGQTAALIHSFNFVEYLSFTMPREPTKRRRSNRKAPPTSRPNTASAPGASRTVNLPDYDREGSIRRHRAKNFVDLPEVGPDEEGTFWSKGDPREQVVWTTEKFSRRVARHEEQM